MNKIVEVIQFFLVLKGLIIGFATEWLFIWWEFGLPIEWYTVVISILLGVLTVTLLFQWISTSREEGE